MNSPLSFFPGEGVFQVTHAFFSPQPPPPPSPPPPSLAPLLEIPPPLLSPPPPKLRCFRGGQVSLYPRLRQGRALYRRVTYQICQEATDIYGGSEPWENAVGAQEAGDDQQRLLPSPPPSSCTPDRGSETNGGVGWGGMAWVPHVVPSHAQLVPQKRLLRIQDLLDVTWTVSSFST